MGDFKKTAKKIGDVYIGQKKYYLMGDFFFGKQNMEWGFVYFTIRQNPLEYRYRVLTEEQIERAVKYKMLNNVFKADDIVLAIKNGSGVRVKMETRTFRNRATQYKEEYWTKIFFARPPEIMSDALKKIVNPVRPVEYENFDIVIKVKKNVLDDFRVMKASSMVDHL